MVSESIDEVGTIFFSKTFVCGPGKLSKPLREVITQQITETLKDGPN